VPIPGPKQLQLKTRGAGVGDAAGGDGTGTNEGTPCGCTGADNWVGALGAGTGPTSGLGGGSCALASRP
jgi:hypothetical protein